MRRPLTSDDLDTTHLPAQTPGQSREMARRLEAWADESAPAGAEVDSAQLLVSAAELLERVGDTGGAVRVLRRAVEKGEPVAPDVRCHLHHALLEPGDAAAARELAEQIRRERPADGDVYLLIGEDHELHGDLREAHRWLTLGARTALGDMEDVDEARAHAIAGEAAHLLRSRRRVRQRLGMPPDDWDGLVDPVDLDALPD